MMTSQDIAAIGLKSVIGNIGQGDGFATVFGKSLVEKLSRALTTDVDDTVMLEILDILTDVLTRFAGSLSSQHQSTLERLVPLLSHERAAVRKRTIQTLASALYGVPPAPMPSLHPSVRPSFLPSFLFWPMHAFPFRADT